MKRGKYKFYEREEEQEEEEVKRATLLRLLLKSVTDSHIKKMKV